MRARPGPSGAATAITGAILLGWALVAGVALHARPGENAIDRWAFSTFTAAPRSTFYIKVSDLGDVGVLVVGSLLAAAVAVRSDRVRALACLVGPGLAVVAVDWVLKPAVGRTYMDVLTYPSGSVAATAGLAAAWFLAVHGILRGLVVVVGLVAVALVMVSVVVLRWHYGSDALGGAAVGIGVVFLLDGLAHLAFNSD